MNYRQIGKNVDEWIDDMELPVRAGLKPIKRFDDVMYPMDIENIEEQKELRDEDEREAWIEYIHSQFGTNHQILNLIEKDKGKDFFFIELDEMGNDVSAFNTIDFHREHPDKFRKYHWMIDKLRETVKQLGIDYGIIKDENAKHRIRMKAFEIIRTEGQNHKDMLFQIWLKYAYWK